MKQAGLATAGLVAFGGRAAAEDQKYKELRVAISSHTRFLKIPGLAAAVVADGKVTFVQTEGFADIAQKIPVRRDHIFPVASLTKTFAAVTLLQYQQEGKLSLDDYVLDYPFLSVGLSPDRLPSPNVKLKHVLSHTSEGEPGANYMYNGGRYSFVYGAFEKMSGNTKHYEAFGEEVRKRIIQPLNLKDTLTGYPADKAHPALLRIVTTYKLNQQKQLSEPENGLAGQTTLYPSAGLLTTLDDLAAYSHALDQHTLLTAESYRQMTAPFVTNNGRSDPYGLGWATQQVDGKQVHWHYGYGDSYAALLIRVPQDKLSFILLSNAVPASEAFILGYGNVLNSVFAQAFFKHVVFKRSGQFSYENMTGKKITGNDALFFDELFSQALMRHYTERKYQEHTGEATQLLNYLVVNDPARFQKPDVSLIYLMALIANPKFSVQMEKAIKAYDATGWFHPDIHEKIAVWYESTGQPGQSREWYHRLADSQGYGEQAGVRHACHLLGNYYLKNRDKEKGRIYLWREALYNCHMTADKETDNQVAAMKI
ncbi:MAG: serine hydrolase domain-containing protein [Bacteroidota bacterium]